VFVDDQRPTTDDQRPTAELWPGTQHATRNTQPIPLKPTGNAEPIDVDVVRHFFSPDGPLGLAFAGYEQRPQQLAMAEAVARAFNNGDNQMVEAGTGTGKGLAYLVPAAMFAAQRGERVVISTNTINLQDQLFFKDIPALQQIMAQVAEPRAENREPRTDQQATQNSKLKTQNSELPFTAALLKGRGNYLCLRRYKQLRKDDRLDDDEVRTLLKVQLWLPTTSTGDKAELLLMDRENTAR